MKLVAKLEMKTGCLGNKYVKVVLRPGLRFVPSTVERAVARQLQCSVDSLRRYASTVSSVNAEGRLVTNYQF
jgi:hypothetical protein